MDSGLADFVRARNDEHAQTLFMLIATGGPERMV